MVHTWSLELSAMIIILVLHLVLHGFRNVVLFNPTSHRVSAECQNIHFSPRNHFTWFWTKWKIAAIFRRISHFQKLKQCSSRKKQNIVQNHIEMNCGCVALYMNHLTASTAIRLLLPKENGKTKMNKKRSKAKMIFVNSINGNGGWKMASLTVGPMCGNP